MYQNRAVRTKDDEDVDFDYKQRAVEIWGSGKRKSNRNLSAVQHRFRKVTSVRQLRRWAGQVNKGGKYMEKLHLQKWGVHAKNILGFEDTLAIEGRRQVYCVV